MNGKPIRNLKELVAEVDGTADAYLRLDLEYDQVHPGFCQPPCCMQDIAAALQVVTHSRLHSLVPREADRPADYADASLALDVTGSCSGVCAAGGAGGGARAAGDVRTS